MNAWLIVEDNDLFQDMFRTVIESQDELILLEIQKFADNAEKWYSDKIASGNKPEIVLVDINLEGSTFDGLEFIRKVNFEMGNDVVIGVISTSEDEIEMAKAVKYGAQFWIKKSSDLDDIIPEFISDYDSYKNRTKGFKIYE